MASATSSALQRSIASSKIYDAFISHRGPDVKETFAKKLYERLQERGCRAFLDRKELEGGDCIPSAIHDAICSSRVQIAIFSKGFAQSTWCLDELVLMLQQRETLFIPVFYGVEPGELRDIDNDKSQYAMALSDYERKGRNLEKLDEWKEALFSASNISGYELSQHEYNLCDEIVSRVEKEMKKWIPLHVAKYPVGLAELVQDFERFCTSNRARDKATIVGIFGLGGAGKTTLAKEFFNNKRSDYNGSCFLSDIRESHTRHDLHSLQSQLNSDLFRTDKRVFRNVDDGIAHLKYSLGRASHSHFLIVLDDIDHQEQLDALLPEESLSTGSLVIITTRDRGMLRVTDASSQYRMKGMDKDRAKELFCSHAFRGKNPPNSIAYEELIDSFVKFCGGLPLSLKVLGAHLYGRTEDYWELELAKVQKIPPKDIMQSFKISFDGLDSQEQQIFIDIACFFNKISDLKNQAITIWNAAGWSAENAVQTLQEKCLVEINDFNSFEMHDHLRDLGRQIADESGPPRLWRPQELRSLKAKGLEQILAQTKARCFLYRFQVSLTVAQRKARCFPFCFLDCFRDIKDSQIRAAITFFIGSVNDSVEPELLWLEIFPLQPTLISIPSWIPLPKLLYLSVEGMEELCHTFQQQTQINTQASFDLRSLRISESPWLQKLPDWIGMFSHLEELVIGSSLENTDPTSLVQSLQGLSNLKLLHLWEEYGGLFSGHLNLSKGGAPSNRAASTSSRMDNLKIIFLIDLRKISKLSITGDMCPQLRSLHVYSMENLNEMDLKELVKLNTLKVRYCPQLETLSSLAELQVFETDECEELKWLSLAHQRHLERIHISHCQQLQNVEGLEELQGLKSLIIEVPASTQGYGWVRSCIHGMKRLPSEFTVVAGMAVDDASSGLNVNLLSEVIRIETEDEITEEDNTSYWRGSSNAVTIYAFLLASPDLLKLDTTSGSYYVMLADTYECEYMVTVVNTPHVTELRLVGGDRIIQGIKVTVSKGEEGIALALLQIIFDRLYRLKSWRHPKRKSSESEVTSDDVSEFIRVLKSVVDSSL